MKKKLENSYDIDAIDMLDIKITYNNFILSEGEFYSNKKNKKINIKLLIKDDKTIFQMKDGKYVLENINNDDMTSEYFYSYDINDLIGEDK